MTINLAASAGAQQAWGLRQLEKVVKTGGSSSNGYTREAVWNTWGRHPYTVTRLPRAKHTAAPKHTAPPLLTPTCILWGGPGQLHMLSTSDPTGGLPALSCSSLTTHASLAGLMKLSALPALPLSLL